LFDQKRYAEAKPWLEKACNLGNTDSCGLLADFYYYGYGGVSQDYEQARLLDKQACDGGNKESCGKPRLPLRKRAGRGDQLRRSARPLQKGLQRRIDAPLFCTRYALPERPGGARDYQQASALFRKACDGAFMLGCSWLARLYQTGLGGPQDYSQPRSLFKKACDGGFRPACDQLSRLP
jgi:hypothetical protein